MQFDLSITSVSAAFGFGSTTGSNEQSHSLAYVEAEGASVVTFAEHSNCEYVAKITVSSGGVPLVKEDLFYLNKH